MKKFLFLLLLPCFAHAQMKTLFFHQSWDNVSLIVDSVKMALPSGYNLVEVDSPNTVVYNYVFQDSLKHVVTIVFRKYIADQNTDLNVAGHAAILNTHIEGPYLALFPVWKKYFNSSAELVETQKKPADFIKPSKEQMKGYIMAVFINQNNGTWWIKINPPMN